MAQFQTTLRNKLIYVFSMPYPDHAGCLKIGEATCGDNVNPFTAEPNSEELNDAARKRINEYTQTAGVTYNLLYTESTVYWREGEARMFDDKEVHDVLKRSGYKRKVFDNYNSYNKPQEWFEVDLQTVKEAIRAIKEGRKSIDNRRVHVAITFRPEQQDAINMAVRLFRRKDKRSHKVLWNAKMRFGKTLSALQVVKEIGYAKTLILTHRPVVNEGWFDDFGKIFASDKTYRYGSREKGDSLTSLIDAHKSNGIKFVYFASMQDLRGSELVGGNFDKNNEIFNMAWDLLIVDEAHEGTQTELGKAVVNELMKEGTRQLALSGTPFNLLESNEYDDDNIYTWDYQMEQRAKHDWDSNHPGDPNPYAPLPTMNIYTYNLGELLSQFEDEDVAFNFREFFRTNDDNTFVHDVDVTKFLDLLTKEDADSCYPFANANYRNIFRHTLWIVPGVKAARALSAKLKTHNVFQYFDIVNVAGNGDEEEESADALDTVKKAIGNDPSKTRTITLTCGRLTTGVSVPAWTAVLMLSGSYSTAAMGYMQTIFRVQTPATIGGKMKTECYVFDFAPDRTLRVVTEAVKVSAKAGKTSDNDRKILGDFLNFCPVIGITGSEMKPYDTNSLLTQLKRVYVERVVRSGFEDKSLYNNQLMKLNDIDLKDFSDLKGIIGTTKAHKMKDIDINQQGFTDEEYEEFEDLQARNKKNAKKPLTDEERRQLEEMKAKRKNRDNAISILRGISIRMPLLIYGAENITDEDELTIDNFASLVDDLSWNVFMPRGVDKETFNKFKRYYDPEVFTGAAKRIRAMARAADNLTVEERIERITNIFATFHNPDKETVLTPWRVVNMHIGDTIGGWCFFDNDYNTKLTEPRFIDHGTVTANVFRHYAHILEINSKTGLYPLYMAYSLYRARLKELTYAVTTVQQQQEIWDSVVKECIFVVCMSPMAMGITKRTLVGFRNTKVNVCYFVNLINQIKNKSINFVLKMAQGRSFWKANKYHHNNDKMKFNAVVGNPPYQVMGGSGGSNDAPIFQLFGKIAEEITDKYVSLIIPSRWFAAGRENLLGEFRVHMLKSGHIRLLKTYVSSHDIFPSVEIKGGICYYLYDKDYKGVCDYRYVKDGIEKRVIRDLGLFNIFIRDPYISQIVEKIERPGNLKVESIISADTPFGIPSNPRTSSKNPFNVYEQSTPEHDVLLYHIENLKRKVEYVCIGDIEKNRQDINKYKVFIPGSGGSGNDATVIGDPECAPPNSVCSQSYLYSAFNTFEEAQNFYKYLKTKFLRFLVSSIKITQAAPNRVYRFVPLQDFTSSSDIDWSASVADIDRQLYDKYGLTADERAFIERMIKPM